MTSAEGERPPTHGGSLSGQEREALARLEARVRQEDPNFDVRLRGGGFFHLRWLHVPSWHPGDLPLWVAALLVAAGGVVTVLAEISVVWIAIIGVALMGLGAYRLALGASRRWRASSRSGGSSGDTAT